MGYIAHDAIVVATTEFRPDGQPDIDAFRESLPAELRPLVIGPIPAPLNGYVFYVFLPDGSKEGWPASDEGDAARARFKALFAQMYDDGSSHDDWVHVRFGGDTVYEEGAHLVDVHPPQRQDVEAVS